MNDLKLQSCAIFRELQTTICAALETLNGGAKFETDEWQRPDIDGNPGGGGISRILRRGSIFEQAGVNFSEVSGTLPEDMSEKLLSRPCRARFYATGISLVLHPLSPLIPTTHANFRYLEVEDKRWFGGGADLTPYYLDERDAVHFHTVLKGVCDRYGPGYYADFKKQCDEYFYLPHRKEARGVGGLFFDYLGKEDPENLAHYYSFVRDLGEALLDCYVPIVRRHAGARWTDAQREFQLIRRGRYVEFNLLYDRGTQFGLKTQGRTESILMSLPPLVRWEYNYEPPPGSPESKILDVVRKPRAWV